MRETPERSVAREERRARPVEAARDPLPEGWWVSFALLGAAFMAIATVLALVR